MKSFIRRFVLLLAILTVPIVGESLPVRLGALVICAGIATALAISWFRDERRHGRAPAASEYGEMQSPNDRVRIIEDLHSRADRVHQMSKQLQEVVLQTEHAALEINDRVIAIIGRARKQLQSASNVVAGLAGTAADTASEREEAVRETIDAMTAETDLLAADVNSVIRSLQFQDMTKQRLEQVINELLHLRGELEMLKERPASPQAEPVRKGYPVP